MLYDFSCSGDPWQMSPKCDTCPSDSFKKAAATGVDKNKLCYSKIINLSSCSDLSAVNDMCSDSLPEKDFHVYKRRKLQRNSVALLSEENAMESSKESACCQSCISSEAHTLTVLKDEVDTPITNFSSLIVAANRNVHSCERSLQGLGIASISTTDVTQTFVSCSNSLPNSGLTIEDKAPVDLLVRDCQNSETEHNCGFNDRCSSSKSNNGQSSDFRKKEVEDTEECSSSDNIPVELLDKFASSKELCIFVLKTHGLLGTVQENMTCASVEVLSDGDAKSSQSCKMCGHSGSLLKMLICDLCEEAFHVSCCGSRIRKLPVDEWYCQGCSGKIPKPLHVEQNVTDEMRGQGKSHCDPSRILLMLRDNRPYTSGARIGRDFQAEVPVWSGPTYCDSCPLAEPCEMDPSEYASLSDWNFNKPAKSTSIGNWVQCREVIYTDDNDEGIVCGKWRRAPLFVVQTDDWDCSCAVLWDPVHADCSVPQELETDVVLKHLKFIEMLRPRLSNNKRKCG